jgi:hypothetical protein
VRKYSKWWNNVNREEEDNRLYAVVPFPPVCLCLGGLIFFIIAPWLNFALCPTIFRGCLPAVNYLITYIFLIMSLQSTNFLFSLAQPAQEVEGVWSNWSIMINDWKWMEDNKKFSPWRNFLHSLEFDFERPTLFRKWLYSLALSNKVIKKYWRE